MNKLLIAFFAALFAFLFSFEPAHAYRAVASCPSTTAIWAAGATSVDPVVDVNGNFCTATASDPASLTPVTNSGTAQTATLPAAVGKTTYICGFSARSNATAAVQGNLTVAGTVNGTLNFAHVTMALGNIAPTEEYFYPCIPASAPNTAIVVTAPAPGAGGVASTTAWGFQK